MGLPALDHVSINFELHRPRGAPNCCHIAVLSWVENNKADAATEHADNNNKQLLCGLRRSADRRRGLCLALYIYHSEVERPLSSPLQYFITSPGSTDLLSQVPQALTFPVLTFYLSLSVVFVDLPPDCTELLFQPQVDGYV